MKLYLFLKENKILICMILILLLAAFLRFYEYENRWGLASDQARDAIVAREALNEYKIPLLGPFSSAGAFTTGPVWYWLIMIATWIYPSSVLFPWIVLTLSYVLVVYIVILIGKEIDGYRLGFAAGILAAVSPAQIAQSTNLMNPSGVAIFSALGLYFIVRYLKSGKNVYLFLFPFSISLAMSHHYQAAGLLFAIPFTLLLRAPKIKSIFFILAGGILPFIPLIIFDVTHDFYNFKNMLQYYLHDQYLISLDVLGRRWLTYIGEFWPKIWAFIVGGSSFTGYIQIILLIGLAIYMFLKKRIQKEWYVIFLTVLISVCIIRYTRAPLFDGYFVFLHVFIIMIASWLVISLYNIKKVLGIALFVLLVIGSLQKDIHFMIGEENGAAKKSQAWMDQLVKKYPNSKFAIYDHNYGHIAVSLPFVLFLEVGDKIDDNGMKVGLTVVDPRSKKLPYPVILGDKGGYQLYDLSSSSSAELHTDKWAFINPSQVYRSTEEWYTK